MMDTSFKDNETKALSDISSDSELPRGDAPGAGGGRQAPPVKAGALNLKVRAKNPVFWVQLALAVALPIGAYFGITAEQVTSWPVLWDILVGALKNPYVLAMVAASVWNALNDPTTKGLRDSEIALSHERPA